MNKILNKILFIFSVCFVFFSCGGVDSIDDVGLFEYTGDKDYISPYHTESSAATNQYIDNPNNPELKKNWYKNANFYHIWVKSFYDSDGDDCGDLKGIEQKLDYIKNLGCDAIWLSPIFSCNYVSREEGVNMHGYDTINYYEINHFFGSEQDLESLINQVHSRGMKIIFDFVPNHTSDAHPWFLESASDKESNKRSWYLWNDEKLSWNNGMSSDTWHKKESGYYYGAFNGMMPDLNFRNYEVREEMKNVVRWWLNKGFDGLRIDASRYLIEEENNCCDTQATHEWYQELRQELELYESPKFMVCEAWIENNRDTLNEYFGTVSSPEFNMVFDFDAGRALLQSIVYGYDVTYDTINPERPNESSVYGTFLGNHDEYYGRVGTVLGGQEQLIKQATALSLLRPTASFIYYGNELGQQEEAWSGDVRLRGPFNWNLAESQIENPLSSFNLNKIILSLKQKYPELQTGNVSKLESLNKNNDKQSSYLAYIIEKDSSQNKFLCVYNFDNESIGQITFLQNRFQTDTIVKVVIGDNEENTIEFTDNTVIVKNLAPYSYRLYYIGSDEDVTNVFDDEIYVANSQYQIIYSKMYLRGNMNNWAATDDYLMKQIKLDNGDLLYTVDIQGKYAVDKKFEFKFDTGTWASNQNFGLDKMNADGFSGTISSEQNKNNNIVVSNIDSSKTYTITLNLTDWTFSVQEKSN